MQTPSCIRPLRALRWFALLCERGSTGKRLVRVQRRVNHFDRIKSAGDFDNGRIVESPRESLGVNGCGGDDELQFGSLYEESLEIAEQKINVQTALMRFINDDGVVFRQQRIA